MAKIGVKSIGAQPVKREELVKAVSEAHDIAKEGLKDKHAEHSWAVFAFAFGLVLKELLDFETE